MVKNIATISFLFFTFLGFGQEANFDDYKYIIVSKKFDFLKQADDYQTSSLTKFLLQKKGFQVFLSDEDFPDELTQNRCLALYATVKDNSDFLTTKSIIEITDCKGKNLYTSKPGKSRLKEYKKAYQESIRNAFDSMTDFKYSYRPSEKNVETPIKKEVISKTVLLQETTNIQIPKKINTISDVDILYAQPNEKGFQLVNTKPEVVFVILKTSLQDIFLVQGKPGIIYKNANRWFIEYYSDNLLNKKELQIKF